MWMNLEPIIHSEVSQKEKNKYHILMHIYGIQKDGTDEPICRAAVETETLWPQLEKERMGRIGRVALKGMSVFLKMHAELCRNKIS